MERKDVDFLLSPFYLDFDECKNNNHTCHSNATCINNVGSYSCKCNADYEGSGFNCSAINKCLYDNMNNCSKHAICKQDDITYQCKCNDLLVDVSANGFECLSKLNT